MEDFALSDIEKEVITTLEEGSVTEHAIYSFLDFLIEGNLLPRDQDFFGVQYNEGAFGPREKEAIVSKVLQVLASRPVSLDIGALKRAMVDNVVNILSVS